MRTQRYAGFESYSPLVNLAPCSLLFSSAVNTSASSSPSLFPLPLLRYPTRPLSSSRRVHQNPHSCMSCGVIDQRECSCPQHTLLQLSVSSLHFIPSSVTIDCAFCGAAQSAGLAPHCGCRILLLVPTALQTVQYRPPRLYPTCIPDWRVACLSLWEGGFSSLLVISPPRQHCTEREVSHSDIVGAGRVSTAAFDLSAALAGL